MMAIIIQACLIADPQVCQEHRIPVNGDASDSHCMLHAPPYFAKWSQDHPGWQIKKWRCGSSTVNDI